jgi:hypothetical protein
MSIYTIQRIIFFKKIYNQLMLTFMEIETISIKNIINFNFRLRDWILRCEKKKAHFIVELKMMIHHKQIDYLHLEQRHNCCWKIL